MVYDYKLHLTIRTPRAYPWEQSEIYYVKITCGKKIKGHYQMIVAFILYCCVKTDKASLKVKQALGELSWLERLY